MNPKRMTAAVVGGLLLVSAGANAASTWTYVAPLTPAAFNAGPPASGGNTGAQNIAVPRWNVANPVHNTIGPGAFLLSVEYRLTGYIYADYTVAASSPTGQYFATFTLNHVLATRVSDGVNLQSSIGVFVQTPNFNHTFGADTVGVTPAYTGATTSAFGNDLTQYAGATSYLVNLSASGSAMGIEGLDINEFSSTIGRRWGANLEVIYTYDIPEAGTYAAIGFLALAGGTLAYRRRKAQA